MRSIPALAGKPTTLAGKDHNNAVYPRARGEAVFGFIVACLHLGLSPRSRGSRDDRSDQRRCHGSIPALAGKPAETPIPPNPAWVYPRARGEACHSNRTMIPGAGLSPRSRGSRRQHPPSRWEHRSIPALAGKPAQDALRFSHDSVYPRARGEAGSTGDPSWRSTGLSPRSRGSPAATILARANRRSIPALAGKPFWRSRANRWNGVYPRARGEASLRAPRHTMLIGLSPRSRGSPHGRPHGEPREGSIPALAGKPRSLLMPMVIARVYPRARGEAYPSKSQSSGCSGLSPRSRGSPLPFCPHSPCTRSIPALAGKPPNDSTTHQQGTVYPRARGEASSARASAPSA